VLSHCSRDNQLSVQSHKGINQSNTSMTDKKRETANYTITNEHQKLLEDIAFDKCYFWGNKPNVSELLRRIAIGELELVNADIPYTNEEKILAALKMIPKERLAELYVLNSFDDDVKILVERFLFLE
jgi:hypothetical protein